MSSSLYIHIRALRLMKAVEPIFFPGLLVERAAAQTGSAFCSTRSNKKGSNVPAATLGTGPPRPQTCICWDNIQFGLQLGRKGIGGGGNCRAHLFRGDMENKDVGCVKSLQGKEQV